jgi:hypothetical protein
MDHSPGVDHTEHNSRRNTTPPNKGTDNQLRNDNINNSNINNIKFRNNQAPQVRSSENDEYNESGNTSDEDLEFEEKDGNGDNNASSQSKVKYRELFHILPINHQNVEHYYNFIFRMLSFRLSTVSISIFWYPQRQQFTLLLV